MVPEEIGGEEAQRRQIEAEFLERLQEELSRLTVTDHLTQVLQTLPSLAFQHLGVTGETAGDRDLGQSRLAIDAFKALVDVLVRQLTPDEVSLYRSTLAQMQMAYVAQVDRESETDAAGTKPAGTPATGAAAETAGGGAPDAASADEKSEPTADQEG
jgi:hypothetical protein